MTIRNPRRRIARSLIACAATLAASAVTATAGPVFEEPAAFSSSWTLPAGSLPSSLAPDGTAAFRSSTSFGAFAGDQAFLQYCDTYGPATGVVGYRMLLGRWHTSQGTAVTIYENTVNGHVDQHDDGTLPYRYAMEYGPWAGPARAMPPVDCVAAQIVAHRRSTGDQLVWTAALSRVAIEDLQGPAVGDLAAAQGWITGDAVPVTFTQSDNAFDRGVVVAATDGGSSPLGDLPDGGGSAAVPVGGLGDGQHVLRVTRSAAGWPDATATTTFRLDRHAPTVPSFTGGDGPRAWTNAAAVDISTTQGTDTASGWAGNEYSFNGGAWSTGPTGMQVSAEGTTSVTVRSVDNAGNRSAASAPVVVRIDRTAPAITAMDVDTNAGNGPQLTVAAADAGGSGLDGCQASVELRGGLGDWVQVLHANGPTLAHAAHMTLPMGSLPSGGYQVRLTLCDVAGNTAQRVVGFDWVRPGGATSGGTAGSGSGGGTSAQGPAAAGGTGAAHATAGGRVRPALRAVGVLRHGRLVVRVRVTPAQRGRVVRLLRWSSLRGWVAAGATRESTAGVARLSVAVGHGRMRVQLPAAGWGDGGASGSVWMEAR